MTDDYTAYLSTLTNLTDLTLPCIGSQADLQTLTCLAALSHLGCGCVMDDEQLQSLQGFPALRSLRIRKCRHNDGFKWIGLLTSLVDLALGLNEGLHNMASLSNLTALTSLHIFPSYMCHSGCVDVARVSRMKALERLYMVRCLRDASVERLSVLTCLTDLKLIRCEAIGDSTLEKLAALTSLTKLRLRHCCSLKDRGLENLLKQTKLAVLDLR